MTQEEKKLREDLEKMRKALERIKAMTTNGMIWEIARKALEETK